MSELQLHETTVTVEIGGEEVAFTTGKLARQAHGAVTVRSGATVVLATAVGRSEAADASLKRALKADPQLSLDPATTAPKVMRALDAARGGRSE